MFFSIELRDRIVPRHNVGIPNRSNAYVGSIPTRASTFFS